RRTPSNLSNASVGSANVNPSFESDVPLTGAHLTPAHVRSSYDYGYEYRNNFAGNNAPPARLSRQNSLDERSLSERPVTLELPRPLRSSLRKYNYSYSPGPPSSRSGSNYSWADSGTLTNVETPPDSSLSEDSSYMSAKDSSSHNSSVNRVRFSPITMVGASERVDTTLMDLPVLDRTVPLQAFRSLSSRTEYSPKLRNKNDYEKQEFLHNF
ncbi:unnamed protein product, partial [Allacma fusca]